MPVTLSDSEHARFQWVSGADAVGIVSSSTNRAVIEELRLGADAVSTVVVYVHGLWQRGAESPWLRRRLAQDLKAETRTFSYPSVAADATENRPRPDQDAA